VGVAVSVPPELIDFEVFRVLGDDAFGFVAVAFVSEAAEESADAGDELCWANTFALMSLRTTMCIFITAFFLG